MNIYKKQTEEFQQRHVGPNSSDTKEMLSVTGHSTINELINQTIPESIQLKHSLDIPDAISE